MGLENKKKEILAFIIILAAIITFIEVSVIVPTEYVTAFQVIAGAIGIIAFITLVTLLFNKHKYNIKRRNYNIKPDDGIIVKNVKDNKTSRIVISNTDDYSFNASSFEVVDLAASNLESIKDTAEDKQVHIYSGDFDAENSINDEKTIQQNIEQPSSPVINDSKELKDDLPINNSEQANTIGATEKIVNKTSTNVTNTTETETGTQQNIPNSAITNTSTSANISVSNIGNTKLLDTLPKIELENKPNEPYQKLSLDIPKNHIIDIDVNLKSKPEEFLYFINQYFIIIRSILSAVNTIAFVWVNHNSQTLDFRLLQTTSDTKSALTTKRQIEISDDVISQIVTHKKNYEILTKLNKPEFELDLFKYYTSFAGTNSFIGVPVFFENTIIAVLCADSKKIGAFNADDVLFLGSFTKIISRLINSFDISSKQENAEQILKLIGGFNKQIAFKGSSFNEICNSITEYILNIYSCSSIGIVSYNDTIKNWAVLSYRTVDNVDKAFMQANVSLDTIIGECITKNETVSVANVPAEFIRINEYEPSINNGSFIAIPIRSITDVYGALFIEYKDNPNFATAVDLNILETICEQAGEMLEKIKLMQLYNKYIATEIKTGILTESSLRNRILEEYNKAVDTNGKLTFALISLDKYAALEDAHKKSIIFTKIIEVIKTSIKQYELIGRINSDVLGVILFNRNSNQAKTTLEKIRQQLATTHINIGNKKLVFTISAGLATLNPKNTFDDFISNATTALRKAESHTNYVQVFE